MSYEIPKEIRSKPKLMGLEVRELIILLIGFFLIFTMLRDMVHSVFMIPYFIVSIGLLLWAVMPSRNNPTKSNYMSIIYFFKRDKQAYHAMDHQRLINERNYMSKDN